MHHYVRIWQPREYADTFNITWELTTTCNYSCSYCPESLHNGAYRFPKYQNVLLLLDRIQHTYPDKRVFIDLTGGEPTLWPSMSDFLHECEVREIRVNVVSNGSRTARWWHTHAGLFTTIMLSFHPEHADPVDFRDKCRICAELTPTMVNLVMVPGQVEQSLAWGRSLVGEIPNLIVFPKPLRENFGSELYAYSPDELALLKAQSKLKSPDMSRFHPEVSGTSIMETMDINGRKEFVDINQIVLDGNNTWVGWNCNVGLEALYIAAQGDIYSGVCRVGGPIGNLYTGEFQFPAFPTRCTKQKCVCKTDMFVTKYV